MRVSLKMLLKLGGRIRLSGLRGQRDGLLHGFAGFGKLSRGGQCRRQRVQNGYPDVRRGESLCPPGQQNRPAGGRRRGGICG